ncbi:SGNH/GDSL hydrolase family protein [Streptococcus pluranimalium]|uniref:SGNH/GDSL hydrolase family protein n=1 Tax=Streptococcus pluranimalium TaxID=82348 RepID=UPI003F691AC7
MPQEEANGRLNLYDDVTPLPKTNSVNVLLEAIRKKTRGADVREAIVKAIEIAYETGSSNGNANLEVSKARGFFNTLSDRLENLDSNLSKALSEVATSDSRIDGLIANAGDGTVPSELTDMRTGSDGFTYTTAGDALRTIGKVVENSFKVPLKLSPGYYVTAPTGEVAQHTNQQYKATDYIDVGGVKTVKIDSKFSGASDGYAFYDKNKKYISGSSVYAKEIAVPASARYFKFTAYGLEDSAVRAFLIYDYNALMPVLNTLNSEQMPSKINNLVKLDFTLTNKRYIVATSGYDAAIEDVRFWSTSYINVSNLSKVTINSNFSGYSDGYSFYDENKNFISGSTTFTSTITVPSNAAFLRFTVFNIDSTLASASGDFTFYQLNEKIEKIAEGVDVSAKTNYSYAIGKTLMIGDSLTSGAYYDDVVYKGTSINQNVPYYLAKMTNNEVVNGGKSGWYPSNWYTDELPNHDITQFDTFFIWLGTNKGLTDTLDTDVNAFDDYNQFANTETGYYCRLIEYIKHHNPDAAIHLSTCFASSGNLTETNATIKKIADKYNLHVIELSDLTVSNYPNLHLGINNVHFGKAGNIFIANRLVKAVNDYYADNQLKLEFGLTRRTN